MPVDDAERQLQVLGDPRSPALMHRNHVDSGRSSFQLDGRSGRRELR
jgi:hypothetical protein